MPLPFACRKNLLCYPFAEWEVVDISLNHINGHWDATVIGLHWNNSELHVLFKFIYYMRCGVAQPVARVGKTAWRECRHSIGYSLARSVLYKTLTVLAAAHPSDVILVSHIHTL